MSTNEGEQMKKGNKSHKILLCTLLISCIVIVLFYLGFAFYFSNHFFFHTRINGIDASCKTAEEVNEILADEVQNYSLTMYGRNEITDSITAQDIGLTYTPNGDVEKYLDEQNPFLWLGGAFRADTSEISNCVTYDKAALEERCNQLAFFQKSNQIAPTNASIVYLDGEGYHIVSETQGATLQKGKFLDFLDKAISTLQEEVTLDNSGCYKTPKLTTESKKISKLYDKVTRYAGTELTYEFGKKNIVLDDTKIHKWLKINEKKGKVTIQKDKVQKFVNQLASKYNTLGTSRTFLATTGNKVTVSGGDYGWYLDKEKETAQIINNIKKGAVKVKKPSYSRTAASHGKKDWGNTFVEINLTAQHLWFYKKGKLVIESDFVSGNLRAGNGTPQGVYYILYRERDAILGARSNASYRTPVDFWMPFNGGIGMHDATWRSKFGGTIYQTAGSHGCINLPYAVAQTIFDTIETGTPVVCYYDPNYNPSQLTDSKQKNKR